MLRRWLKWRTLIPFLALPIVAGAAVGIYILAQGGLAAEAEPCDGIGQLLNVIEGPLGDKFYECQPEPGHPVYTGVDKVYVDEQGNFVALGEGIEKLLAPPPAGFQIVPTPVSTEPVVPPGPSPSPTPETSRIVMTMEGPAAARPGETLTYRLTYEVRNVPGTGAVIAWSPDTINYVSSRLIAGSGQVEWDRGYVRWALEQGPGVLEVTLQVPENMTSGNFNVGAYEPGTGTTSSNTVATTILPP